MADERSAVNVEISVQDLPNARALVAGMQCSQDVEQLATSDTARIGFDISVDVITTPDGIDYRGPFVHGRRGERFLYICWGSVNEAGQFRRAARTKLMLGDVDRGLVNRAVAAATLRATVSATDEQGELRTGRVRPPAIEWST